MTLSAIQACYYKLWLQYSWWHRNLFIVNSTISLVSCYTLNKQKRVCFLERRKLNDTKDMYISMFSISVSFLWVLTGAPLTLRFLCSYTEQWFHHTLLPIPKCPTNPSIYISIICPQMSDKWPRVFKKRNAILVFILLLFNQPQSNWQSCTVALHKNQHHLWPLLQLGHSKIGPPVE